MAKRNGRPATARGKSTKPPVKRSPKPPAKTAKRAPRTKKAKTPAGRGRIASPWRKGVADRWVITWRCFDKLPWKTIVQRDGRTQKALETVVADYMRNVEEGDMARPLERDPVVLCEQMALELETMRDTMLMVLQGTTDERVAVAAGREWRRMVKELRELLQAVGALPRELGSLRFLVEVREAAMLFDKMLDGLEDGSLVPADVRARLAEWSGVKAIEGTAVEEPEAAAA